MFLFRASILTFLFVAVGLPGGSSQAASDYVTYESVTVAATSIGITSTIINPVGQPQQRACSARLETAQVRFRYDGTAPTAAEGTLLEVGEILDMRDVQTATAIRFIRTGATSGVLKVTCWR